MSKVTEKATPKADYFKECYADAWKSRTPPGRFSAALYGVCENPECMRAKARWKR